MPLTAMERKETYCSFNCCGTLSTAYTPGDVGRRSDGECGSVESLQLKEITGHRSEVSTTPALRRRKPKLPWLRGSHGHGEVWLQILITNYSASSSRAG